MANTKLLYDNIGKIDFEEVARYLKDNGTQEEKEAFAEVMNATNDGKNIHYRKRQSMVAEVLPRLVKTKVKNTKAQKALDILGL